MRDPNCEYRALLDFLELLRTNMDKEMAERMHNALRFGLIETDVMATFETLKAWLVKDGLSRDL